MEKDCFYSSPFLFGLCIEWSLLTFFITHDKIKLNKYMNRLSVIVVEVYYLNRKGGCCMSESQKSPSEFYKMNNQIDSMIESADNISARLDKITEAINSTTDKIIALADEAVSISANTLQVLKTMHVEADGTIRFELPENSDSEN